jgi:glycine cleavage system H lipoate-binding protein/ABC-type phosphate transport system substrate-binding protein
MKTRILTTAILLLLINIVWGSNEKVTPTETKNISIYTSPETSGLVESWTSAFTGFKPEVNFQTIYTDISEVGKKVSGENAVGIFIKTPETVVSGNAAWQMVVGRNVIVAIINKENPYAETLYKSGVSANNFSELLKSDKTRNWNQLISNQQNAPLKLYFQDTPGIEMSVSNFLNVEPALLASTEKKSAENLLETIGNDIYAIGFCLLSNVTNSGQNDYISGIKLLPVDKNNNGNLDHNENFYNTLENFERAVWIGKYPKSLIQNIYAVLPSAPSNENIKEFLSWVVTSGQQYNVSNGYSDLVYSEMQSNMDKLNPVTPLLAVQSEKNTSSKTWMFLIVSITAVIIFATLFIRERKISAKKVEENKRMEILNEDSIKIPGGLFFDKSHTWIFMEKNGKLKIGIDDFLQHVTGKITGIEMKAPGEKIAKNELILTLIQEGKKINIYSSVSGIVKEINEELVTSPSLVNSSPYSKGWVYIVEPTNWQREISFLKIAETYREWIKREFVRLKDFVATISNRHETEGHLVFQEGGELYDNVLQQMGPKVWEDFQIKFIDNSDIN